jgi:hypothetical protein
VTGAHAGEAFGSDIPRRAPSLKWLRAAGNVETKHFPSSGIFYIN